MKSNRLVLLLLAGLALAGCGKTRNITSPEADDTALRSATPAILHGSVIARGASGQDREFVPRSDNPLFPLVPGTVFRYRSETEDGVETQVVTVTRETRRIAGVNTIVVKDVVRLDGKVIERTSDYFAMDEEGNVWYFGEDTRSTDPETGEVSTDGSWRAGEDGAGAGIIMKAHPQMGDTYKEEDAPGVAEDMARVIALDASADVPYEQFTGCLETENFTPLEPGVTENKFYAPGVGLVLEVDADNARNELVSVRRTGSDDGDEDEKDPSSGGRRRGRGAD